MLVSIIIPTYKDLRALELIMEALKLQTYTNFEAIVAEDDNSSEIKNFLDELRTPFVVKHFSQEDQGLRKSRAVNNAVRMSVGDYLIYIDGDTIPYTTFIHAHVKLAEDKRVLCGRRVNLGDKVSSDLRKGRTSPLELETHYLSKLLYLTKDNIRHYEQGLYFKPDGIIQRLLSSKDKNAHIVASNFSCYKKDMLAINGSDEAMQGGPGVDDTDVEWRLKAIGVIPKSCKFSANLFHLNHPRNDRKEHYQMNMKQIEEKQRKNEYRCNDGIIKE